MSTSYPDLNLTNFPETVDIFVSMLNITASDSDALSAYQTAMETGNVAQASQALSGMVDAQKKILTADKINKMFDSIQALERFYSTDIIPYVQQLQATWQAQVDRFDYKGEYSSSTAYVANNIVSYTDAPYTFLYICTVNTSAGIDPTNTNYWRRFTVIGPKGESGSEMSFLYEWESTTSYSVENCVTYNGAVWGCLVENLNQAPFEGSTYWEKLASLSGRTYPIQPTEPGGQEQGDLWFQQIGSDF